MSAKSQRPESKAEVPKPSARATSSSPVSVFQPASLLSGAIVILIITFIVYAPAIRSGFIWDDNDMVTENHLIHARDGLRRIWFSTEFVDYFPLTQSSLWIEARLWGGLRGTEMKATGFHITNVLLHALTSIVFWRILLRLKIPGAWWVALFFALHPVNVESVAWITERKNTLSLFFYALSILLFLRSESLSPASRHSWRWYAFSLAAFGLSLLSKTSTVMLPFLLLGLAWWQRGKITRQDFLRAIPFFTIALVMGLITIWLQYNRAITETIVNESTFPQRLAGAGWAVWFYLWKALLPVKLCFVYPRWTIDPRNALSYLPGLAVFGVLALFWWKRRMWGRAPLFAFGYFVVALFPVLGFFNIYFQRYSFVADHWQYVSIVAVIALVVGAGTRWLKQNAAFAFAVVALTLSILTWRQNSIYKNQGTLWHDTLAKNPRCWMAESNWGLWLANQGRLTDAMPHYEAALRIKADDEGSLYNLGVAFLQTGRHADAVQKFHETLSVNPNHKLSLTSLAWILAINKDPALRNGEEAVRLATRGVELTKGRDEWLLDTLAAAYAEAGRFDEAIQTETKAIEVAQSKGDMGAANDMKKRLNLYQAGRPFREGD